MMNVADEDSPRRVHDETSHPMETRGKNTINKTLGLYL